MFHPAFVNGTIFKNSSLSSCAWNLILPMESQVPNSSPWPNLPVPDSTEFGHAIDGCHTWQGIKILAMAEVVQPSIMKIAANLKADSTYHVIFSHMDFFLHITSLHNKNNKRKTKRFNKLQIKTWEEMSN